MEFTQENLDYIKKVTPGDFGVYRLREGGMAPLYVSGGVYALSGMTREEHRARFAEDAVTAIHPGDRPGVRRAILACSAEGVPFNVLFRVVHKSRVFDWVRARGRVCGRMDGDPVMIFQFTTSSAETNIYQDILDRSDRIIYIRDRGTGELLYANQTARDYGTTHGGARMGDPCYRFMRGREAMCADCALKDLAPGGTMDKEAHFKESDTWLQIHGEATNWCGHEADVVFMEDMTTLKRVQRDLARAREQERAEYNRAVQGILTANPDALCTFRLNLTRNRCFGGHGASAYILAALEAPTVEGFLSNLLAIVPGERDRRRVTEVLDRRALLASFKAGRWEHHLEYRRLGSDGRPFWVCTDVRLLENPDTGDAEALVFSRDISGEKQRDDILKVITNLEYDMIALLHPDTGLVEAAYLGQTLPGSYDRLFRRPGDQCDFTAMREHGARTWVVPEDRSLYLEGTRPRRILDELEAHGHYDLTVRGVMGGRPICRRLQHYYLNDDQDVVLIIDSDVTEAHARQVRELDMARSETEKVRDIMDSITGGIAVLHMTDPDHLSFAYVNLQLFRILNFEPLGNTMAEIAGSGDPAVTAYFNDAFSGVHPDDIERVRRIFRENYGASHFVVADYRCLGGDGCYVWLSEEVTLREVTPGYRVFYATYRDVGEEVRLRSRLNERLEEEKSLRRQATAASAAKSDFLSRMSHDIRTPLNGIIGMSYLASCEDNPPRTAEYLKKIDTSSQFLLGLVGDVLDMSKVESDTMTFHPEPYPYAVFGSYVEAVIRPLCRDKDQNLVLDTEILEGWVPLMDTLRVNQIFFNLLSNAVKYTPEGGTITLGLKACLTAEGRFALESYVKDTGVGMSAEFQKVLFDPFSQEGRDDVSAKRGTGLGLAIVKKLVDRMGGTIAVTSAPGRGTTFTLELVFDCLREDALPTPAAGDSAPDDACLAGRHVLLCEDHPLNQEIARTLLERKGMGVSVAENGQRGVDRFARSPVGYYDAVLMDIRMPVMDGYEATRALRALPRRDAATVPILAMTADTFASDVQKCLDAGMNGHIAKPLDVKGLYGTLARVIGK